MYSVEKTSGINTWRNFDFLIFLPVLTLSVLGLAVLSSATRVVPFNANGPRMMLIQVVGMILGIIVAFVLCGLDYNSLKSLGVIYYIFCSGLLVLVLFIGSGESIGSRSWIRIPGIGINIQPSEFTKIAIIIMGAIFLERIKEGIDTGKNTLKYLAYSVVPISLIIAQRDFGTAMVFLFILLVMVFVGGIPYKYILALFASFLASTPFIWFFVLNETRRERIRVFLDPTRDPLNHGLNVIRSKMAIGSGQIFGKGLYQGLQTQTGGVPVDESDFIFSVVGEELGLIGSLAVIILLFFILVRSIHIAKNARDGFGSFLVMGVTAMIAFHTIENIGMNIGLLPVTGVPLPFISQGASAMLTNYMAVGILLSVSMRRKRSIFKGAD